MMELQRVTQLTALHMGQMHVLGASPVLAGVRLAQALLRMPQLVRLTVSGFAELVAASTEAALIAASAAPTSRHLPRAVRSAEQAPGCHAFCRTAHSALRPACAALCWRRLASTGCAGEPVCGGAGRDAGAVRAPHASAGRCMQSRRTPHVWLRNVLAAEPDDLQSLRLSGKRVQSADEHSGAGTDSLIHKLADIGVARAKALQVLALAGFDVVCEDLKGVAGLPASVKVMTQKISMPPDHALLGENAIWDELSNDLMALYKQSAELHRSGRLQPRQRNASEYSTLHKPHWAVVA